MKVTLELPDDLYRAVKVEAARADRTVRDITQEAIEAWLTQLEDAEDVAASQEAIAEYERDGGGVVAEEFFRTIAAETRATYGSEGS
jgi:predicted DNA-binding protein